MEISLTAHLFLTVQLLTDTPDHTFILEYAVDVNVQNRFCVHYVSNIDFNYCL